MTEESSFLLSGFANLTKATTDGMFVAADIILFKIDAMEIITRIENTYLGAPAVMQFVSHASLKFARKTMIEIETTRIEGVRFHLRLYFFSILVMQLDCMPS